MPYNKGVIHRDVKPANILLDKDGQPRVTDFGLAKKIEGDSALTGTGQILGTPSYMPPEQAACKTDEIGPLADVYSLGAIFRPDSKSLYPMRYKSGHVKPRNCYIYIRPPVWHNGASASLWGGVPRLIYS